MFELIRVLTDCLVKCCRFYYPVYKSDSEEAMIIRMEQHLNRFVNVISDYEALNSPHLYVKRYLHSENVANSPVVFQKRFVSLQLEEKKQAFASAIFAFNSQLDCSLLNEQTCDTNDDL